jgi:hypothetical protein
VRPQEVPAYASGGNLNRSFAAQAAPVAPRHAGLRVCKDDVVRATAASFVCDRLRDATTVVPKDGELHIRGTVNDETSSSEIVIRELTHHAVPQNRPRVATAARRPFLERKRENSQPASTLAHTAGELGEGAVSAPAAAIDDKRVSGLSGHRRIVREHPNA